MANGLGENLEILNQELQNSGLLKENQKITGFAPDITIFSNFERDHLDWHDRIENYFGAKMRLVERTRTRAYLGSSVYSWAEKLGHILPPHPELCEFGTSPELSYHTDNSNIFVRGNHICRLEESIFRGNHNALNLLSVVCVAIDL